MIAAVWMALALAASLISIRLGISVALAEIDPASLRRHLKPSLAIGAVSFAAPLLGAFAFAYFVAHFWSRW